MTARTLNAAPRSISESRPWKISQPHNGAAALIILAVTCAVVALRTSQIPYLWAVIAVLIALIHAAYLSTRSSLRALWVNMTAVALVLGAAEGYFWAKEPLEPQMQYSEGFFFPDETLG